MSGEVLLPVPTPETADFWAGTAQGRLLLQQCDDTGCQRVYFPPQNSCPSCGSRSVSSLDASGRATLYSYIINHRPAPGFEPPFVIAVVTLEEGPRMMTNIVECAPDPEALKLDMPLRVTFKPVADGISLPLFKPDDV